MPDKKKKLMVIVGAGASVELGMPSVGEIDTLFSQWAKNGFTLANDSTKTLYCYIKDEVNRHYSLNPKVEMQKQTNFEELLYVMLQLASSLDDHNYILPTNAFFGIKKFPKILSTLGEKSVDGSDLTELCSLLIDNLLAEFRSRCKDVATKKPTEFESFSNFMTQLSADFDVGFLSLNYDNLITQVCPSLFTGFNSDDGNFEVASIYDRRNWGLIYHLHGSIHFDMKGEPTRMHAIKWNSDLSSFFSGNSRGRNYQDFPEGISMPTSSIVAGYGKTNQIQRLPFRTYFSRLDEMAAKADAFLFLGYGFGDIHLNNIFHSIRSAPENRPVVVIDYSSDNQSPMEFRYDDWSFNLCNAITVDKNSMRSRKHPNSPPTIKMLKNSLEFEVSTNEKYPLSIWHGGFIEACKNYEKIKIELDII